MLIVNVIFTSFTPPPITATPHRYNVDNIRILQRLLAECPQLKMMECVAQS